MFVMFETAVASLKISFNMENATQAAISGHIAATLLQRRGVHNNEADKRNFN